MTTLAREGGVPRSRHVFIAPGDDPLHRERQRRGVGADVQRRVVPIRCRLDGHVSLSGEKHIHVHAIGPEVDTLPRLTIEPRPTLAPLP